MGKLAKHLLYYLAESTKSKAATEEAVHTLVWIHSMAGITSPTENPFVKIALEGLRSALAKPIRKKEPITAEMLKAMVQDAKEDNTLSNVWLTTACLLSFAGFLRFSELVNLCSCNLSFSDCMIRLHLPCSKVDQLQKGNEVVIARTESETFLVSMLEQYMQMDKIPRDSRLFLFRHITKTKQGEQLKNHSVLSFSTLRDYSRQR